MMRAMAALLLLTGCAVGQAGGVSDDAQFMRDIRNNVVASADLTRAEWIEMGHNICRIVKDEGDEYEVLHNLVVDNSVDADDAAAIVAASEFAYCPEVLE